jgi:hypothetical protein
MTCWCSTTGWLGTVDFGLTVAHKTQALVGLKRAATRRPPSLTPQVVKHGTGSNYFEQSDGQIDNIIDAANEGDAPAGRCAWRRVNAARKAVQASIFRQKSVSGSPGSARFAKSANAG